MILCKSLLLTCQFIRKYCILPIMLGTDSKSCFKIREVNSLTRSSASRTILLPITNYQLPITNYQLPITNYQLGKLYSKIFSYTLSFFSFYNTDAYAEKSWFLLYDRSVYIKNSVFYYVTIKAQRNVRLTSYFLQ